MNREEILSFIKSEKQRFEDILEEAKKRDSFYQKSINYWVHFGAYHAISDLYNDILTIENTPAID